MRRYLAQLNYVGCWLAFNQDKTVFFGTLNVDYAAKMFFDLFPHLIIKKRKYGVTVRFPACDK